MDFALTDSQRAFQREVRELAQSVLLPRASERDATETYPIEECRLLGERGLMGVALPVETGGRGLGVTEYALAVHEVAAACPASAVTMSVTNMVGDMIERFGTPEQRARFLPLTCRGELPIACFCLSEAQAGSDAASLRCRAVRDGDRYVLNGTKMWVTSGAYSSVALVMARTDPEQKARGVTAFLLEPRTQAGWTASKAEDKMGLRGSNTAEIALCDCVVHASDVLAGEGMGFAIAMTALDGGRIGIGAQALGIARTALELASKALLARGGRAGQAALLRLADAATAIEAAWLMVQRAAYLRTIPGRPMTRQAAMAKVFATEQACRATELCLEILGQDGLDAQSEVERCLRDIRVTRIYEGTSEIQRLVVARELLKGG